MKTVIRESILGSINDSQSPQREQERPERALVVLDQTSQITSRSEGDAGIKALAEPESLGLATILGGGLTTTRRTWRSQATSISIHALLIVLLFAITVPIVQEVNHPRVILIAPQLNQYKPKINRPHVEPPHPVVTKALVPPPVVKLAEVKVHPIPPTPVIKQIAPVASVQPMPKIDAPKPPPAPKPQIRTGVFEVADLAKAAQGAKQIKTGGFGDPNGVPANAQNSSSLMMAKLGSFDLPNGDAKGGAGGRSVLQGAFGSTIGGGAPSGNGHQGSVRAGGFGDGSGTGTGTGTGNGHGGAVRSSGFGDGAVQAPSTVQRSVAAAPATTSTEILFKPKPAYSEEARNLKIEGQVALEVVFQASGTIRVMRVVHGLGHGLDEAAEKAAQQVRFHPATRGGVPVDTTATIYITFELT